MARWYNGYSFLGEPVYNPFDILLFLKTKEFRPFWFETGTPSFLVKLLIEKKLNIAKLEHLEVGDELLESFDVDRIYPETILFQTGYLTIKNKKKRGILTKYILGFPNLEVKVSFNNFLLNTFTDLTIKEENYDRIYSALEKGEVEKIKKVFKAIFAGIPYDWFRKNNLEEYEGFYASVFYAYFSALGLDVRVEDAGNQRRLDMAVFFDKRCYLFEFKVIESEPEGNALSQLKEKGYFQKYLNKCQEIYLIGVEFSKKEKNIINFEWEKFTS